MDKKALFRALPSVDALLKKLESLPLAGEVKGPLFTFAGEALPRTMVRNLVNRYLKECREGINDGWITESSTLDVDVLTTSLIGYIGRHARPHFRRVLNATGVVIHTNLGRSPLAEEAVLAVAEVAAGYSNLEFDLASGERGSRYSHVENLLCQITGAEAALVVNNNAAAVMLVLDTLCKWREAIVARGQLVEIGGSFRIPEVMEKSNCTLHEVGATNRVRLSDYENAINDETAALMKVHTSNYRIIGFHSEVSLTDLAVLGAKHKIPVIEDLGSGNLIDFNTLSPKLASLLGKDEPTVQKSIAEGADVVTFSGDKVLGGPQAGIIVGKAEYINQIKKNPLNRALRIDKMTLAALEATLRFYLEPELALTRIPTLQMICAEPKELEARAILLAYTLRAKMPQGEWSDVLINVIGGKSLVGGGSFPERYLPTSLVSVECPRLSAQKMRELLLHVDIPIVARVDNDKLCLDVRTLKDAEFSHVAECLAEILQIEPLQ